MRNKKSAFWRHLSFFGVKKKKNFRPIVWNWWGGGVYAETNIFRKSFRKTLIWHKDKKIMQSSYFV